MAIGKKKELKDPGATMIRRIICRFKLSLFLSASSAIKQVLIESGAVLV